jgi:hypothetical protein
VLLTSEGHALDGSDGEEVPVPFGENRRSAVRNCSVQKVMIAAGAGKVAAGGEHEFGVIFKTNRTRS